MVWSPNHQNLSKVQLQSQLLQLRNWVAQLPDALIQARPRLLLAQGWVLALLGQLTAAEKLLTNSPLQSPDLAADIYFALAGFVILTGLKNHKSCPTAWLTDKSQLLPQRTRRSRRFSLVFSFGYPLGALRASRLDKFCQSIRPNRSIVGELALLRSVIAGFQSDPIALDWAQQALALLPLQREELRVTALNEIGLAYMRRSELAAARHTLLEAARRAEAADIRFIAVDALATIRIIQVRQGQLLLAAQTCQQTLDMVARWGRRDHLGTPPATGMVNVGLGEILAEWNDLAGQPRHLMKVCASHRLSR